MDKEEMKNEEQLPTTMEAPPKEVQTSKREQLRSMLSEEIEGYNMDDDEEASGQLMGYVQNGRDQRTRMAEALQSDPRLAQVLSDVVSGKRGAAAALARYFGKDAFDVEEGTPEYEEIMQAEEERKQELEAFNVSKKEYEANLEASMPVIEQWCQKTGVDQEQFMDKIWAEVISPVMAGTYSEAMLELLNNGFNYAQDTQDAMKAGEVKGRNQNINKLREEVGDGLPKAMPATSEQAVNKKKKNSFIESALGA